MLLLRPNRVVGVQTLIDAVWDQDPPATARGPSCRPASPTCAGRWPPPRSPTHPEGYALAVAPEDLDVATFERLVAEARGGAAPGQARLLLRQALDLWQGPALAGLDGAGDPPGRDRAGRALRDGRRGLGRAATRTAGPSSTCRPSCPSWWSGSRCASGCAASSCARLCQAGGRPTRWPSTAGCGWCCMRSSASSRAPQLQDLHRRILSGERPPPPRSRKGAPLRSGPLPRSAGDFTGREALSAGLLGDLAARQRTDRPGHRRDAGVGTWSTRTSVGWPRRGRSVTGMPSG